MLGARISPPISIPNKHTISNERSIATAVHGASIEIPRATATTPSQKIAYALDGTPGFSPMTPIAKRSTSHAAKRTPRLADRVPQIPPRDAPRKSGRQRTYADLGPSGAAPSVHSPLEDLDVGAMWHRLGSVLGDEGHAVAEAAQLAFRVEEADADADRVERRNGAGDAERALRQLAQCRRRSPAGDEVR